jgi:HEAT repeat protein
MPLSRLRRSPPVALLTAALALGCGSSSSTSDGDDDDNAINVGRSDLEVSNIGVTSVNPTNRTGFKVEFDVDGDTLSTVIVAAPTSDQVAVAATELTDPAGNYLLRLDLSDADAVLPSLYDSAVRAYPFLGPGPFALLYPGSPDHPSRPGTYAARYHVFEQAPKDVQFFAIQKRRPAGGAEPKAGKLPITFWFAQNDLVDADGGADAKLFRQAVDELTRIYASAGIEVGSPTYRNLPADAARRFSVVDANEFGELFTSVDTSSTPGLNFFVVSELELDSEGGVVVGLANGIPGPPALPGLPGGGVVVSLVALEFDPTLVGQIMAHEGGHYLGLMHTTERTGTIFDLLEDTPQCPASEYDTDGDDAVDDEECAPSGGSSNLMFWSADGRPQQVSADQGFVLLRNPMVDTSVAAAQATAASRPAAPAAAPAGLRPPALALSSAASNPLATTANADAALRARLRRAFGGYDSRPDKPALERLADADRLVPALVELAADANEPPYKRANALASLRFFAAQAGARAELSARAADAGSPRLFRRTAARALAAAYGDDALATLAPLLEHADPDLRETVVRAVGAVRSARSRELLASRAPVEADPNVRLSLSRALPRR